MDVDLFTTSCKKMILKTRANDVNESEVEAGRRVSSLFHRKVENKKRKTEEYSGFLISHLLISTYTMCPSIHNTGVPLPKPPPDAHAVRAKPDFTGIIFHVLSAAVMANGFLALLQLGMTEWINGQVSVLRLAFSAY